MFRDTMLCISELIRSCFGKRVKENSRGSIVFIVFMLEVLIESFFSFEAGFFKGGGGALSILVSLISNFIHCFNLVFGN